MPKNKREKAEPAIEKSVRHPIHTTGALAGALGVSFFVNFVFYLITLAPTVTFEDSGEFISAAYNLGIPHEPGYPLFNILARFFTLLPFGAIAYRVNLLSAFFTAAAGVCACWATILLIENTFLQSRFFKNAPARSIEMLTFGLGICSAILFGTASSAWEQAIITEVYGLNSFLVGLFLLLALQLERQPALSRKKKALLLMCYVSGFALANHTTSLMLVPLLGVYLLIYERNLLVLGGVLLQSAFFFILGLTPYVYLPLASRKHPMVDWGNPENLTNFIRVVTRHQYNYGTKQSLESFTAQFSVFCSDLLMRQWMPFVLLFAVAGLFFLFQKNRRFFYFTLAVLLFTMPVTTWMTNFDVSTPASAFENKELVSVFYIPGYLITAILMGIGLFGLIAFTGVKQSVPILLGVCLPLAAAGSAIVRTMPKVTMHKYTFAQDYCDNVFNTLPKDALYFVNWDPFNFPLMYYQYVEKKRPDLLVLDQLLLRRSWYVHWLQRHYPEFTGQSSREVEAFLRAVEPFEKGEHYRSDHIQSCYIGMINAFIDSKLKTGTGIYFTYTPEPSIMRSFHLEPQFSAYKYTQQPFDTAITDAGLHLSSFTDNRAGRDRMAEYVRNYYGNLFALRGLQLEAMGDSAKARYCFRQALPFFNRNTQQALFVEQKLAGKK